MAGHRRRARDPQPAGRPADWWSQLLLAALAALTAVATVAVQASGRFKPPVWLLALLYGLAAVLGATAALAKWRFDRRQAQRAWRQQVKTLLAMPLDPDGRPPRLSTVNPYWLGVSPSRYGNPQQRRADPYVPRHVDADFDDKLGSQPFMLVVGDSKAGKSRTAYEAARQLRPAGAPHDPRLLVPNRTEALGPLLALDPPLPLDPKPALLWLDDLTEGDLAALTPGLLDQLADRQVIVLGTITAQRHDRVQASDSDIGRNARRSLARASEVRLEAAPTAAEWKAARAAYPQEPFHTGVGIGEQLVAAGWLTSRYDDARQGAQPAGWAVVQAAIDWVRLDIGRPIGEEELHALYPIYLAQLRPHAPPGNDLSGLLDWACTPAASHVALLQRQTGQPASYLPFDYLVDQGPGKVASSKIERSPRSMCMPARGAATPVQLPPAPAYRANPADLGPLADDFAGALPSRPRGWPGRPSVQPIPNSTWDQVPTLTSPAEALRAATSAYYRHLPHPAQRLFQAVIDSGDPDQAPPAAYCLGVLLAGQGEVAGAKAAFQRAIDSGHKEAAPPAMNALAELLSVPPHS